MINVLIVDDNKTLRREISKFFDSYMPGCRTFQAASCNECNNALMHHQIHMVIMDIRLASENGLNLVRSIKERFPKIHVVVHSMYDAVEYKSKAKEEGADRFLSKKSHSIKELLIEAQSVEKTLDT